jgi:carbonic anhydrase
MIDDLLRRNRAWAAEQRARDPEFFTRLLAGQRPAVLWIGCSDSRVPAEQIVGCGPGELFIHRNVANVVAYNDVNLTAVLQYAVESLKIPDIIVCGHYGCGGVAAACADKVVYGHIGDWLMITAWARRRVDEDLARERRQVSREEYLRLVVEKNIRLQIKHLSHLSVLRKCWEETPGIPRLHGWVYDMATGLITVLVDGRRREPGALPREGAR